MKLTLKFAILLAVVFIFTLNDIKAQPNKIKWQTCFDKPGYDKIFDIIQIDDGYILTGSYEKDNYPQLWIIKVSEIGDVIWEREYGGSLGDGGRRIYKTHDDNYFIIGYTASVDGDINENPYSDTFSFWLVKLDPDGNMIWNKVYGNSHRNNMENGIITSDHGVVMFGWVTGPGGDVSRYYGAQDMWVVKTDKDGNKLWDYTIGTPYIDFGISVIETSDKGVLLGGSSLLDPGGNIECEPYTWDNPEAILFKLDSAGNYQWQKCYGGSGIEWIATMAELPDGYLLGCTANSDDGDLTGSGYHLGYHHTGAQTKDIWLVKIDFDGNIHWQKCYGGTKFEGVDDIHPLSNGNIVIIGTTGSFDGDVVGNHSTDNRDDIWMFEISPDGELLWQRCIGGENDEGVFLTSLRKSDSEFVIAADAKRWNGGDITCDVNGEDTRIWLFEIADTTVGVNEHDFNRNIKVYPNPSNEAVVIDLPVSSGQIEVFNTMGVLLHTRLVNENKVILDCRDYPGGMYLVKFTVKHGNTASKKIIVNHFK